MSPPLERPRPGEDRRHGVRGGLLAFEMTVIVPRHRAVGRLELHRPVRGHQHRGHHCQGSEGRGDHVAHDIAVVVLQGPDEAAFRPYRPGDRVVDEGIEIRQAPAPELRLVMGLVLLLEDLLERAVVDLGDRVLGGEPQILLRVQGVLETAPGESADALLRVVLGQPYRRALGHVHVQGLGPAALPGEGEHGGAGLVRAQVHRLVHVAVGVTGHGDGGLPSLDHGLQEGQDDGGPEGGAVQDGADRAVGGPPHLRELGILLHALFVGCDGSALDSDAQPLRSVGGVQRDLIFRLVAVEEAQVVILRLQVHEGEDQLLLDPRPQDPGHLVPVHLHQRNLHPDLVHLVLPSFYGIMYLLDIRTSTAVRRA